MLPKFVCDADQEPSTDGTKTPVPLDMDDSQPNYNPQLAVNQSRVSGSRMREFRNRHSKVNNSIDKHVSEPHVPQQQVHVPSRYNEKQVDQFWQERKKDRNNYHRVWQALVGAQDILLKKTYQIVMKASNLSKHILSSIWDIITEKNDGYCVFDQFADICKLVTIALDSIVPLFLINKKALIWYHPIVPAFMADPTARFV